MSMSYWGINGFGVCIDDIYKYIDNAKVNRKVREANPEITFEEDVFDDDTFYGDPYTNIAEFICETFDTRKILTWDDDGNGRAFLLYEPPYPWKATQNEPKTLAELGDYMVSVLRNVCDAGYDELADTLDYISKWGCG